MFLEVPRPDLKVNLRRIKKPIKIVKILILKKRILKIDKNDNPQELIEFLNK